MSTPSSHHFSLLTAREDFHRLEPEWDAHVNRSGGGFFMSWAYVSTWLRNAGPRVQLAIATARDSSGRLTGIAPFCIVPGRARSRRLLRHLTFAGGQFDSLAEYGDFLIEPGMEAELAPGLVREILGSRKLRWDLLYLEMARAGSPSVALLRAEAEKLRPATFAGVEQAWICALPPTWEAFIASRSSRVRYIIRNREKNFMASHPQAAMHVSGRELSHEAALEELIRLNRMRWGSDNMAFHTERFVQFHRDLLAEMAPRGLISISLLHVDGKYVAGRYDFMQGDRVLNFQAGWDPEWADWSVSTVLLGMTLRHHLQNGRREYDFMAGDARYKKEWSARSEPLLRLEVSNPRSLRIKFFQTLRSLRALLRRPSAAPQTGPVTACESLPAL